MAGLKNLQNPMAKIAFRAPFLIYTLFTSLVTAG